MEGYQNFVELLRAREINMLRAFCVCAALRPSVRMRFRHVYQHFLQRHYYTSPPHSPFTAPTQTRNNTPLRRATTPCQRLNPNSTLRTIYE